MRTKVLYKPGIGPHTEKKTVELTMGELMAEPSSQYAGRVELEVPYIKSPRSKCDICLGSPPDWEWSIEVKMLRLMGANGKPNDNILMHILSPYPAHRSAVTDCRKLLDSGLGRCKGIVIYGYDYDEWPMDPAIESFELLARQTVELGDRQEAAIDGLVHPVHRRGRVFGWKLEVAG